MGYRNIQKVETFVAPPIFIPEPEPEPIPIVEQKIIKVLMEEDKWQ